MSTPANLYSLFDSPNFLFKSSSIFLMRSFLLKSFKESLILKFILASSLSTDIYGVTISCFMLSGILLYKTAISKLCNFLLFKSSATLNIEPKDNTLPTSGRESK